MARLLITGGSGFLGQALVREAAGRITVGYTYFRHRPVALEAALAEGMRLDVRQATAVRWLVDRWRPTAILHLAGSNRTPDMTATIVDGARHITAAASAAHARLIHLSSDVIFDGRAAPYAESAAPQPIHDYGRAKADAEVIVGAHDNHVIVRTSLIYDPLRVDHGTAWLRDALARREAVTLFTDQWRNPVWSHTLARACLELVDHPYRGILNIAGAQALTRAEFGLRMLDWYGVTARDTLALGPAGGDRWPPDVRLDLTRARRLLAEPLLGVDDVLARHTAPPTASR